jgi:hypothetical protein
MEVESTYNFNNKKREEKKNDEDWPTVCEFIKTLNCKQMFGIYDKLADMDLELHDRISPAQQKELKQNLSWGCDF